MTVASSSSALLRRPLDDELEVEAAEMDEDGEGGTEGDGDGGTWLILFLDEEESMLEDRGEARVRETITKSEAMR